MVRRYLQFEPVDERVSLKDRIYIQMKTAIEAVDLYDPALDLRLEERDLAAALDCSRTPLREALTRLENEGILEIVPRKGVFIVRKSKAEIVEMIHAWAGIESMAARLAAERADEADIAALAALTEIEGDQPDASDVAEFDARDVTFHFSIIRLSGCPPLLSIAEDLYSHIRGVRRHIEHTSHQVRTSVDEHMEIVDALVTRNASRAESLVRDHILGLAHYVDNHVEVPA